MTQPVAPAQSTIDAATSVGISPARAQDIITLVAERPWNVTPEAFATAATQVGLPDERGVDLFHALFPEG